MIKRYIFEVEYSDYDFKEKFDYAKHLKIKRFETFAEARFFIHELQEKQASHILIYRIEQIKDVLKNKWTDYKTDWSYNSMFDLPQIDFLTIKAV